MNRLVKKKEVEGRDYFMCNAERCDFYECVGCEYFDMMLSKLYHYEDLEEQGRLIELPCKVGDTVYVFKKYRDCKLNYECNQRTKYKCENDNYCRQEYIITKVGEMKFSLIWFEQMGKTVFLTKEEAEAKLKELKGE